MLHSAREFACPTVTKGFYLLVNVLDKAVVLLDSRAKDGSKKLEIFLYGKVLVQGEAPRHIAHTVADLFVIADYVATLDRSTALIGENEGGEHTKGSGFARPIGAYKPKKLSFFYL